MRGGSLTRFRPDDQFGSGFLRYVVGSSFREGWKGLKTGGVRGLPKSDGKRAVKRKAQQVV